MYRGGRNPIGSGFPSDFLVDSSVSRRFPTFHLKIRRTFTLFTSCIYHKSVEIRQKFPTKVWFHDLWKRNGWDGSSEVWRVEFRLTREFLYSVHIEDVHDLPERLPSLWEYCAGRSGGGSDGLPDGWLRYVTPTDDTNRSRWPVHPAWAVMQQAFTTEDEGLGLLVRERIREKNMRQGLASVIGYLSTLSAWDGVHVIELAFIRRKPACITAPTRNRTTGLLLPVRIHLSRYRSRKIATSSPVQSCSAALSRS
jgi:hypothetical protein